MLLLPVLLLFITPISSTRTPPKYQIDLNEDPFQRWDQVIQDHLEYLPGVVAESKFSYHNSFLGLHPSIQVNQIWMCPSVHFISNTSITPVVLLHRNHEGGGSYHLAPSDGVRFKDKYRIPSELFIFPQHLNSVTFFRLDPYRISIPHTVSSKIDRFIIHTHPPISIRKLYTIVGESKSEDKNQNVDFRKYIPKPLQPFVWWVASKVERYFPTETRLELEGIAAKSGLPLGEIVGLNILYDIAAFDRRHVFGLGCTSIVAQNSAGQIFHGRNLDYDMTGLLKNITVYVDFMRNGSVLYSGVTFALYTGVLTGQRPGAYSISLNARYSGAYIDNILMEFYTKFNLPVSFFIRDVLEKQESYEDAVSSLSKTHLFSPSYIIVAGTKKNEGALISRNRWSAANVYPLDMDANHWFLVETNYDNWQKQGDDRRITAIRKLKQLGKANFNEKSMVEVLSTAPVQNNLTVFSSVIVPARPEVFDGFTWIWD